MTVAELITKLQGFNPAAKVVCPIQVYTQRFPASYNGIFSVQQMGDNEVRLYTSLDDNQHVVTRKSK